MALEADAVRFVLFDAQSSPSNVLTLWQTAMKGMPSGFQQAQQVGAPSFANGQLGRNQAILASQPGRLELSITAPRDNAMPPTTGTITDVPGAVRRGASAVKRLLGDHPVTRLAVVLDLSEPMADEAAAAARFSDALPFMQTPPRAIDLLFQVNRRIDSQKVNGVELNRLCKWATALKQLVEVQVSTAPGTQPSPLVLSSFLVFSVTFDVNTVARSGILSTAHARALLDEVANEAVQLLVSGYDRLN